MTTTTTTSKGCDQFVVIAKSAMTIDNGMPLYPCGERSATFGHDFANSTTWSPRKWFKFALAFKLNLANYSVSLVRINNTQTK